MNIFKVFSDSSASHQNRDTINYPDYHYTGSIYLIFTFKTAEINLHVLFFFLDSPSQWYSHAYFSGFCTF